MADKPSGDGPNQLLWTVITIIIILFFVNHYVEKLGLFVEGQNPGQEIIGPNGEIKIVPSGDLSVGKKIISEVNTKVRQIPGGAIIGEQSKRAIGKILEGPVDAYERQWFRVDFEKVPDGWVSGGDITSNVGLFRALNIVPIFLDFFRPIAIILAIIFLVILFVIYSKKKKVEKFVQDKKRLQKESLERRIKIAEIENNEPVSLASLGLPSNLPIGDASELGFTFEVEEQTPTGPKNEKWERVKDLLNSHNTNDWRQAVIEADIILDEMLDRMGYEGDSIGEKLKQIEESDFLTLNKAWEAHKIRNHIAHRGGDFIFSKNEAERVIRLYEAVFDEFYYI